MTYEYYSACLTFCWRYNDIHRSNWLLRRLDLLAHRRATRHATPRVWATETPTQRSVNLALLGGVIALSSSLANLVQFQLGKVIADPYMAMLAGGAVSGVLVALIAAFVDATRKRILLVSLLTSIGFCILLWLHATSQG